MITLHASLLCGRRTKQPEHPGAVFAEANFLRAVGRADDSSVVTAMGEAFLSLLQDPGARAAMTVAGQRLIDGQGALRVARTILAEVGRMRDRR